MSNPYAFMGLPMGNQAAGSSNAGAMNLGHNLALGNLPFPNLIPSAAGLQFGMQPTLGLSGLGPMLAGQSRTAVNRPPDLARTTNQDQEILTVENGKELQHEVKARESRKRGRSESLAESDDDIMVLSNSPSSNEANEQRENNAQSNMWEMGLVPNGSLGFSLPNPASLVSNTIYPTDPSSFMAAMGSQMSFDFGLMGSVMANVPTSTKEPIHFKSCVLYPPNPQAPMPTTRERPLGCRTVFVGGLAENISEEVLKEIFERCGGIITIRMSKKNFAHVRFEREIYVDHAIQLSGYRIRLNGQKADAVNNSSGRLHVDFAQARDDQYEYECQARRLEREQRHRQRIEEEKWRPPSPPPVPHYAEHEAHVVVEQLKNEERFGRAVQILATWLERGDCSKRNSNGFYSMIQSAHAHLRRLGGEKAQLEEEAKRTHETLRQKFLHLTTQLGEMERLFQAASHQKAWDHFTKAQRKSLESWRKHVVDLKSEPTVEFLTSGSKNDDNMEFSDSDSDEPRRYKSDADEKSIVNLKEENDSLRCQLEAYKNEVETVRSDLKTELQLKEQQIKLMEDNVKTFKENMQTLQIQTLSQQAATITAATPTPSATKQMQESNNTSQPHDLDSTNKLISLLSVFLSVHHLGTSLNEAFEFVSKTHISCTKDDVESVLTGNQQLFACSSADLWRFKLFFQ